MQWYSLVLAAGSLLLWPVDQLPGRRGRPEVRVEPASRPLLRALVAGAAILAAVLLVWPTAFLAALVGAGLGGTAVHRAATRVLTGSFDGQLAIVCDLWSAGMEAGLSPGGALTASLTALDIIGPTSPPAGGGSADATMARLVRVAGLLQVGADPARAWLAADGDERLVPIATAANRTHAAGADLAAAIREQGTSIRRAEFGRQQQQASRAGVLMTAPLALCFLPSFICLGLAPVVIALVDTLDIGR